jgi:hypothetical protein
VNGRVAYGIAGLATVVAAAVVVSQPAHADAAWEFNPTVEAGYMFDDNFRLSEPGGEIEVQGALLDAELEMRILQPAGEFSFTPRVRATYFPDESEVDGVDYFGALDWQRRGLRLDTRVRADFAQQDVVNSEQPDAALDSGLGEPVFGDAGRVITRNRRNRAVLRPSISYELSEKHELEVEAGYTDVSFRESVPGAQEGFDTTELAAGLRSRLTDLSTLSTRARAARYDIENRDVTTAYGLELQWDTRNARDTRTFLRGGAQQVELAAGGTEIAWLAGGGVSYHLGRNDLFADLSRSVGPSSAGIVVSRDQLRLRWTRDVTPRLTLLAGVRGTHDEDVDPDSTFVPRSYATGDIGLLWRWQEEFSLRVAADYTWQKFRDAVDDATSSGATVSILYQPLERRR